MGAQTPALKGPGHESDHLPTLSAEGKYGTFGTIIVCTPTYVFVA